MSNNTVIDRTAFEDLAYRADLWDDDRDGVPIRDEYSGRAMYGDTCFGLVVPDAADVTRFFMQLAERAVEDPDAVPFDYHALARSMRTDNMGRSDTICYFPGYELTPESPADAVQREEAEARRRQ